MQPKSLLLGGVLLAFSAFAAEPYDKKLEFIETTGTQWIDTGLKLHLKNSSARINVRILEAPASGARYNFAGACNKGSSVATSSFCFAIDNPKNDGGYRFVFSFTGSDQTSYCWPNTGLGTLKGLTDFRTNWELENVDALHGTQDAYYGTNKYGKANGRFCGGYYKAPNQICPYNFYIGAANNGDSGLVTAEGSLPKMQWFGVRIFTSGELVGDFIPVLKNGVAGFYDNVSQQFFASQGADPFVAPTEVLWTGAAQDDDFTNGDNWHGGTAPSTIHQVAVFPASTQIQKTVDAGCAFFQDVGAVRLVDDAVLELNGISAASTFYSAIGGTGTLKFVGNASSTTALTDHSSLQNFYGECIISNIYVYSKTPYSLGLAGRSHTIVSQAGSSQRLYFLDNTMPHGEIHLRRSGAFMFSGNNDSTDAVWVFDGYDVKHHHNYSSATSPGGSWTYTGEITGNQLGCNAYYPYSGVKEIYSGASKHLYYTQLQGGLEIRLNTQVHSTPRVPGTQYYGSSSTVSGDTDKGSQMANIRMDCGKTLRFGCSNALDEHAFVQFSYGQGVAALKSNVLDLGGCDNRMGTLSIWASTFDPATLWNPNLCITSDAPATLTIRGQLRCDGAAHVFPGLVRGAAGVKLDSSATVMQYAWSWADANVPGKIKFNAPGSDTTGILAVNRGTMEIMPTATFSNLSEVVVSGEGIMKVHSPDVGIDNDAFVVRVKDATATLELTNDVHLIAYTAEMPGGEYFEPGTYSGTEQAGATYTPYLTGEGTMKVLNYGKPWSGWPEAGTTNIVKILAGTAVTIVDSDIPKVAALEKVVCGTGVTIDCYITGENPLDLAPNFIGDVKIRYWGRGSTDAVTISGDNSGLVAPGGFVLSNCAATVTHRYGLGTAATAPAELHSLNGVSRSTLYFAGDDVTQNDVELIFYGAGGFGHGDKNVDFIQNNNVTVNYSELSPEVRRMYLKNHITVTGGHTLNANALTMGTDAVLTIEENATLYCNGNFGSGSYIINGSYIGNMAMEQCMKQLKLGRDNALTISYLMFYDSSFAAFAVDLDGHSQSIARYYGNVYPYSNWSNQQILPITSSTPATLSITGSVAATTKAGGGISFSGAAGCRIACGNTQSNVFGKGVSRTTGSLIIDSGRLFLERGFTWIGPETQLNGGTLIINADTTTNVFGQARGLTDRNWMNLKLNGGVLHLNSQLSVTTTVYSVQSASDGSYLEAGVYKAPYDTWLTGNGTLRVLHKGPRPGVMMIIR